VLAINLSAAFHRAQPTMIFEDDDRLFGRGSIADFRRTELVNFSQGDQFAAMLAAPLTRPVQQPFSSDRPSRRLLRLPRRRLARKTTRASGGSATPQW
jgi:hypothetical protein